MHHWLISRHLYLSFCLPLCLSLSLPPSKLSSVLPVLAFSFFIVSLFTLPLLHCYIFHYSSLPFSLFLLSLCVFRKWVSQAVRQSFSRSLSQSVSRTVTESISQTAGQSCNQSLSQPVSHWVSQSVKQSDSHPISHWASSLSVSQSPSQSANQSNSQSMQIENHTPGWPATCLIIYIVTYSIMNNSTSHPCECPLHFQSRPNAIWRNLPGTYPIRAGYRRNNH